MIKTIESEMLLHADALKAKQMEAYMKDHFQFYGIQAPIRTQFVKPILNKFTIHSNKELFERVFEMWDKPQREWQYVAIELLNKYKKQLSKDNVLEMETLILSKSWWDTVDLLASTHIGYLFKKYPDLIDEFTEKWMSSNNIWLQRTCVIHQLKYKMDTDTDYLTSVILQLNHSNEFFIQKAIGWSLRQYAKYNPEWVQRFVDVNPLKPLSKREALKNI
jgi:3-methyladenine DNA glycosylase AlkD